MHPLAEDFSQLKDAEIETRVSELSKKYWQSSNPSIQNQISLFLDLYNDELKCGSNNTKIETKALTN